MRSNPSVSTLLTWVLCSTAALGAQAPLAVSPGSDTGALVEVRCPTFSWAEVSRARSYELVVYHTDQEVEETLRQSFPPSVYSWTPPLDRCLVPGGRYAWMVGITKAKGAIQWSEPALFEVAGNPRRTEVEVVPQTPRAPIGEARRGDSPSSGAAAAELLPDRESALRAGEKREPNVGSRAAGDPLDPPLLVAGSTWALAPVVIESRSGDSVVGATLDLDSRPATGGRRFSIISTASGAAPGPGKLGIYDNTDNRYRLVLESGGNLGLGDLYPDHRLVVAAPGPGFNGIHLIGDDTNDTRIWIENGGGSHFIFDDDSSGHDFKLESAPGTDLVFNTDGANPRMRLKWTGELILEAAEPPASKTLRISRADGGNALSVDRDTGHVSVASLLVENHSALPSTRHACWQVDLLTNCSSASEYVPTVGDEAGHPEIGDLVSIVQRADNPAGDEHAPFVVARSRRACDDRLLGFINDPRLGADGTKIDDSYLPLAIYGYFPVKVTMENGPIRRGDPITSSSRPGYGMKATGACRSVGYALQDADEEGLIQVYAEQGETAVTAVRHALSEVDRLRAENQNLRALTERLQAAIGSVTARLEALEGETGKPRLAGLASPARRTSAGMAVGWTRRVPAIPRGCPAGSLSCSSEPDSGPR